MSAISAIPHPAQCLYKSGSGDRSTQEYHIYPKSASQLELKLATGIVCDKCNAYFAKLEKHFIENHPGASDRLLGVKRTRKGKTPQFVHKAGVSTRTDYGEHQELKIPLEEINFEELSNGDLRITGTYTPFPFDSTKVGRILSKMALEFLIGFRGHPSLDLDPYSKRFDGIRQYARFGFGKPSFIWFAWKKDHDAQILPTLISVQEECAAPLGLLCRLSLPKVAFLIPLPPFVDLNRIQTCLSGWNIVDSPGIIEQASQKVELTLIRVPQ